MRGVKELMEEREKDFERKALRKAIVVLFFRVAFTLSLFLGIVSLLK